MKNQTCFFPTSFITVLFAVAFANMVSAQTLVNFVGSHITVPEDTGTLFIEVEMSAAPTAAYAIDVQLIESISTGDCSDYDCTFQQSVVFAPGSITVQQTIAITLDAITEPTEDLYFRLDDFANDPNIQVGPDSIFRITIEGVSVVNFQTSSLVVDEIVGNVQVALTLDPVLTTDYTINVSPNLGASTGDCSDFDCAASDAVTFLAGDSIAYRIISVTQDNVAEQMETLHFRLVDTSGNQDVGVGADSTYLLTITSDSTTGIASQRASLMDMTLYPNPASSSLSLEIQSQTGGSALLQISNTLGQIVYRNNVALQAGRSQTQIDLTAIPTGYYIVSLQLDGKQTNKVLQVD